MSQRENYLMIDHRASPGMTEQEARAAGLPSTLAGEGKLLEAAVLVCAHCAQHAIKNPLRTRERAVCHKCSSQYICDVCEWKSRQPGYLHIPFVKVIDDVREGVVRRTTGNIYLPHMKEGM